MGVKLAPVAVGGGTLSSGAFSSFAGVGMLFVGFLSTLSSGAVVGALFLVCRGREEVSWTGTSGAIRTVGVRSKGGAMVRGSLGCGWI